jgi:hypothetical protein
MYELTGVRAQVGGASGPLTLDTAGNPSGWTGQLSLAGVNGDATLTVTATDAFGATGSATVDVKVVPAFALTIDSPVMEDVARPKIRFKASCAGGTGCKALTVSYEVDHCGSAPVLLASGTDTVDQEVDLSAYNHTNITVHIEAMDASNKFTSKNLYVNVEDSASLMAEDQVSAGRILDFDERRLLFKDSQADVTDQGHLVLRDRSCAFETPVATVPQGYYVLNSCSRYDSTVANAALTSLGAVWYIDQGRDGRYEAYEWNGFALLDQKQRRVVGARGKWVLFGRVPTATSATGGRRNVETGTEDAVDLVTGGLADDGSFVYVPGTGLSWWRAGTVTPIANDGVAPFTAPLTDGTNVVWEGASGTSLYFNDGQSTTTLAPRSSGSYALRAGWTAFTQIGASGVAQVWRRSPTGEVQQVSFFSADSRIEDINPSGDIVFVTGQLDSARRYLAKVGQAMPTEISGGLGTARWNAGGWHLMLGRSLFAFGDGVVPSRPACGAGDGGVSPPDAGIAPDATDSGSPDAGVDLGHSGGDAGVNDGPHAPGTDGAAVADVSMPLPDGPPAPDVDAGMPLDAATPDVLMPAPSSSPEDGGGCSLGRAPGESGAWPVAGVLLAWLARRRRRSSSR